MQIERTLGRPIAGVQQKAIVGTHDGEKKLVQHLKRRQETEVSQLGRVRTAVLPGGKPQERVLTVAPFLARHGPQLLSALTDEIELWYDAGLEGPSQPS